MKKRSFSKKIEILEEKPNVVGPVGENARKLFFKTKECWKPLGLTKTLPKKYIVRVAKLKERVLHGLTINVYWTPKDRSPENAICTVVLFSTEIAKNVVTNKNKNFTEYLLLHEMNHVSSALITRVRSAKDMFSEAVIDYLTTLEISCINNKEPEFINELMIFIHAIIKCSKNDDEAALRGIFEYCFNKRVRSSANARKRLAESLGVDSKLIKNFENASRFKDMKNEAQKVFKDFNKTFKKYTP